MRRLLLCAVVLVVSLPGCSSSPREPRRRLLVELAKCQFRCGRLLLKLTFTPGQTANVAVTYNAVPTGFTVNIGDSATNDGGRGDARTQSNDAEMMVQGQQLSVFGRDGTPAYPLLTVPNAVSVSLN